MTHLSLALGAQASSLLGLNLAIFREKRLQSQNIQVSQFIKIDLVAAQLRSAASTLKLARTCAQTL
jgi:hypothetical protein